MKTPYDNAIWLFCGRCLVKISLTMGFCKTFSSSFPQTHPCYLGVALIFFLDKWSCGWAINLVIFKSVKCNKMFECWAAGGTAVMTWMACKGELVAEWTEYQSGDLVKQQLKLFAQKIAASNWGKRKKFTPPEILFFLSPVSIIVQMLCRFKLCHSVVSRSGIADN